MTRSTVLVVEDHRKTIELVSMYLKRDGRSLHTAVTVSMVFRLRAEAEIAEFEERTDEIQLIRMEHWLLGYHSSAGGWHD